MNPPPRKLTSKVSVLGLPIYSLKKTRNAGVSVRVTYLQFKKKQGMQISGFSLIIL